MDQLDNVVLEECLFGRIEELDRGVAVSGVRAGETEIKLPARSTHRCAMHAEFRGTIFILGKWLRIDEVQVNLAVRAPRQFLQELAHATAVGLQHRQF